MIRALLSAASGMKVQQMQVDTIANNLANVNTTGFKKNELAFRDLLYETLRDPGAPTAAEQMRPTGLQIGSGAEVAASFKAFRQGELAPTANPLDLALVGPGFFSVRLPNGEIRYTRDGSFRQDGNNALVTSEGYALDPPIQLPPDALEVLVGEDGTVSALRNEASGPELVGNVALFRFANPSGLKSQGGNLYSETVSSGAPQQVTPGADGAGIVRQGYLERSNVQVVDELVALILAQRNYEISSRAIRVSDEMLQQVNGLIR
jgi:flagellar basal-body rod protein FlgG